MNRFTMRINASGLSMPRSLARIAFTLACSAIAICLLAGASIHSHTTGLHTPDKTCYLCALENITAHGIAATPKAPTVAILAIVVLSLFVQRELSRSDIRRSLIRAPPAIS